MVEQNYTPVSQLPAEGRSDIAENLEEEQRNAYSAHHAGASSQKEATQHKSAPLTDVSPASQPPAEGRSDIAENLEEEQRNAYSAHHTGSESHA